MGLIKSKSKYKHALTKPEDKNWTTARNFTDLQICFFLGWKLDPNSFPNLLHEELIIYIFKIGKILFEQETRWIVEKNKVTSYQFEGMRISRDKCDISTQFYSLNEVVRTPFFPIEAGPTWKIQRYCQEIFGYFQIAIITNLFVDEELYRVNNFYLSEYKSKCLALLAQGEFGTDNLKESSSEVIFDVSNLSIIVNGKTFPFQADLSTSKNLRKNQSKDYVDYQDMDDEWNSFANLESVKEVALCVLSYANCAPLSVEILSFSRKHCVAI